MDKMDLFIGKVNNYLLGGKMDFSQLSKEEYRNNVCEEMKKLFKEVYGDKDFITGKDCKDNEGEVIIPGILKGANGKQYVSLFNINVNSLGKRCGTHIFHEKKGVILQQNFKALLPKEEYEGISPYKYRLLIKVAGDIHGEYQF